MDPAGRIEFDHPHHAALEIGQPPRKGRLADRLPEVTPIEQGPLLRRTRAPYPGDPAGGGRAPPAGPPPRAALGAMQVLTVRDDSNR